jgi:hypothetical protein
MGDQGLSGNKAAADSLSSQTVGTPCGSCPLHYLNFEVKYAPTLDNKTQMRTYKAHTIKGPETRNTEGPFPGYKNYDHPITPGTYKLKFDFKKEDLRFADFNFTAVLRAAHSH